MAESLSEGEAAADALPHGLIPATVGKGVASAALRLPYTFIKPIASGLGTSVGHLGAILGLGELLGLLTGAIGRSIDRGQQRRWMIIGLVLVTAGTCTIAAGRSVLTFGVGFGCVSLGIAWYTTAGHGWIASHVPYVGRGRAMGTYEMSWALALLVGAPVLGLLLSKTRWWTPFLVLAALSGAATLLVAAAIAPDTIHAVAPVAKRIPMRLDRRAAFTIVSSFFITFSAVSVFAVYGAWLEDHFGVSAATVGVLSVAIGLAELAASAATIRFTDRWGKTASVRRGAAVMAAGLLLVIAVPAVPAFGVLALVAVFIGFEFGFVSLLNIVSEVGQDQRGAVVAVDHALTTASRAGAAVLATNLYDHMGMRPAALVSLGCLAASMVALAQSRR